MTPLQREWIDALRSGQYDQVAHMLYSAQKKGFCCLGVACVMQGAPLDRLNQSDSMVEPEFGTLGLAEYECRQFAELNDDRGLTFHQIADVAERYFESGRHLIDIAQEMFPGEDEDDYDDE